MRPIALLLFFAACSSPPTDAPPVEAPDPSASVVRGSLPRATGGFPSVILFEPEAPLDEPVPVPEPAKMDQYGLAFYPKVLLVRLGQPVLFKNSEDVLHNVHVIDGETRETVLNIGTPVVGAYQHSFDETGAYDVSCNIHPSMAAYIIVSPAPFAAIAESGGAFSIEGIPPGAYRVTVWNLDPKRRREEHIEILAPVTELDFVDS